MSAGEGLNEAHVGIICFQPGQQVTKASEIFMSLVFIGGPCIF